MLVRGVPLELHPPGDYVSDAIRLAGDFYEAAVLDEVARQLAERPPGLLVDAGAMIGNHTTYLAAFAQHTEVRAFEPVPANLALLLANTRAWPTVHVHPLALSDGGRQLQLRLEPGNLGHATTDLDGPGAVVRVHAVALDDLELDQVALLKVDVEGHEPQVLAGARRTLERWRPLVVLESWQGRPDELLPGYQLVAEWERAHQTYLYAPVPGGQA